MGQHRKRCIHGLTSHCPEDRAGLSGQSEAPVPALGGKSPDVVFANCHPAPL
jgi:hypothetical protein